MKPYLSCMNAITKHMKDSFIIIPTTWANRKNPNTPSTSSQISKDSPMNSQPNKSLNTVWAVPLPKNLPVTLHCWTILMLQRIRTLNCELVGIGSTPPNSIRTIIICRSWESKNPTNSVIRQVIHWIKLNYIFMNKYDHKRANGYI